MSFQPCLCVRNPGPYFTASNFRPCNLPILRRGDATHSDAANDFAARHDREAAFDRRGAGQAQDRIASAGDAVFKFLGRAAEHGGVRAFSSAIAGLEVWVSSSIS